MTAPERQRVIVAGRDLTVSRLNRVLWPEEGLTKAALMEYLLAVAPVMLPHLRGRPLSVVRYPEGIKGESFYQKNCPPGAPDWVRTHTSEGTRYVLADEVATLVWLANQNAVEFHPWLALADTPHTPTACVIDLDPMPPAGFPEARRVAFWVKAVLDTLNLAAFPKLSGGRGIHIYIPTGTRADFDRSRAFAQWLSGFLAAQFPQEVTNARAVRRRGPRVYIDPLQNAAHKTVAAPYSPRARPGAPVSAPVTWEELEAAFPGDFTLLTMPERVRRLGDPFAPVLVLEQELPDPRELPPHPRSPAYQGRRDRSPAGSPGERGA